MARPEKEGLDYFPLDVDMDQDDKVRLVEAEHGVIGFAIIVKLLMKIYKEGYHYDWGETQQLLFLRGVNVDINEVIAVVNSCLKWDLFNNNLFEKHGVLTSTGIQRRYAKATSRRKDVKVVSEYWLLPAEEWPHIDIVNINEVNVRNNPPSAIVNDCNGTQSKVKESTVQERRPPPTPPLPNLDKTNNNKDLKTIYDAFSNNIHPVTPMEAEDLAEWVDEGMEPGVVVWAIKEAVRYNKRSMKYIRGILTALKAEGITTVAGAEARERNRKQSAHGKPGAPRAREPTKPTPEEKKKLKELTRLLAEKNSLDAALDGKPEEEVPPWEQEPPRKRA